MKHLLINLMLVSFAFARFSTGGYSNNIIDYVNFTDSLIVVTEGVSSAVLEGEQGPVEDIGVVEISENAFHLSYRYDSTTNQVTVSGRGEESIIDVDSEMRPVRMTKGNIKTTLFYYTDSTYIVEEYPNDTAVTEHSKRWTYKFTPEGDTSMIIITPTDWEYGGEAFWGVDASDTVQYHYDSEGVRTAITSIKWRNNLAHSRPWRRTVDSLEYTYEQVGDETHTTLTQLSEFGDTWITMSLDTQYIEIKDADGQIQSYKITRYDGGKKEWDPQYFKMINIYYDEFGHIVKENIIQHYGDGTRTLLIYEVGRGFEPNPLRYPDLQVGITEGALTQMSSQAQFSVQGNQLQFSADESAFDAITVYSIRGQVLRSIDRQSTLSLDGLAHGQTLLVVASRLGQPVATTKIVLQ